MRVSAIRLKKLSPFSELTIQFPDKTENGRAEVQIITGQNGTGKTRLLCALAGILGDASSLLRRLESVSEEFGGLVEMGNSATCYLVWDFPGYCQKTSGKTAAALLLENQSLKSQTQETIETILASHMNSKSPVAALAFSGSTKIENATIEAMKTVPIRNRSENLNFGYIDQSSKILQTLTNLKLSSAMEQLRKTSNDQYVSNRATMVIERLEASISAISGKRFSFEIVSHPNLSIRVHWGQDQMQLSALPDGLRSIIGWLAACAGILSNDFPDHDSPLDIPAVIMVDEPETHLHPAWQQRVIPAAQMLLPNAQIFVATHSPFVVSSVNSGFIHVLSQVDGKIAVSAPMECSKGDTWIDAVEDALGLKTWYDPETEELLSKFRSLRDEGLSKKEVTPELKNLAVEIGCRSASLSNLMGSEMYQLQRMIEGATAQR